MLKIMSQEVLRSILKEVYASTWLSISADETVDASFTEQVITIYLYSTCTSTDNILRNIYVNVFTYSQIIWEADYFNQLNLQLF